MWSLSKFREARESLDFIPLTSTSVIIPSLLDAMKIWTYDPYILFHTGYRIAGNANDIGIALSSLNLSQRDVENILGTSISINNFENSFSEIYTAEYRKKQDMRAADALAMMLDSGDKMSQLVLDRSRTKRVSLDLRIRAIPAGKTLDVSKLQSDGKGAIIINEPTAKSKKYGTSSLKIVSSSMEKYLLAIGMLTGGRVKYAAEIRAMAGVYGVPVPLETSGVTRDEHDSEITEKMSERNEEKSNVPQLVLEPTEQIEPSVVYPLKSRKQWRQDEEERLRKEAGAPQIPVASTESNKKPKSYLTVVWKYPEYKTSFISYCLKKMSAHNRKEVIDEIENIVRSKKNRRDVQVLQDIANLVGVTSSADDSKNDQRTQDVLDLVPDEIVTAYLDYGCGDGSMTVSIGRVLRLPRRFVLGYDIVPMKRKGMKFIEDTSEIESGSISIITALSSLHHMTSVEDDLREMNRVLSPGGTLIIREHDFNGQPGLREFLDLIHVYAQVVDMGVADLEDIVEDIDYRSRAQWNELIESNGFSHVRDVDSDDSNPQRFYYSSYSKDS